LARETVAAEPINDNYRKRGANVNYIDLFAGAGGLSEGFIRAGFNAVAHIEMNPEATSTLKTRLAYWHLYSVENLQPYYKYLRGKIDRGSLYELVPENVLSTVLNYKMDKKNVKDIFKIIDKRLQEQGETERVQLIVGGPPCQAYSLAGRAKQRREETARASGVMIDDERKYLYTIYCMFLRRYKPEMFVFENVPGLLSVDEGSHWAAIQKMLRGAGYNIDFKELNAKDFGVPQERKRIIIIGWRKGTKHHYPEFKSTEADWSISNILADLPAIQAGEESKAYRRIKKSGYVAANLRTKDDVLTWHVARPHTERDKEIYKLAIREWLDDNKHRRIHYQDIPERLRTHKNLNDFADRFKVVAPDIPFCHTMLAHISKDGHYFIHPDIKQSRSLTVREAARIQSFPDSYFFEGSRTSAFTQIGNAVPPLMAQKIAEALMEQLRKE
jgi:DNA (cytosine-5)-methyltransferase 1